jgi:hypothetical protein
MCVTYCYRNIPLPGTSIIRHDYVVTSVTPTNPSCTIDNPSALIVNASLQILTDNPQHFGFDNPCPLENAYNYVAVQSTCWTVSNTSPAPGYGYLYSVVACDISSFCMTAQAVCVDPVTHQLVITIYGHWAAGSDEPCTTQPPVVNGGGVFDDPSLWTWGPSVCYNVNPCNLQ